MRSEEDINNLLDRVETTYKEIVKRIPVIEESLRDAREPNRSYDELIILKCDFESLLRYVKKGYELANDIL